MKRELRRHGPNAGMSAVLEAWSAAVGPEIARNAWPARFQRDSTLIVHTQDAVWSFELGHRAAEISARLPGKPPLKFVPGPLPELGADPAYETNSARSRLLWLLPGMTVAMIRPVAMTPGAMQFAVIPNGPRSRRRWSSLPPLKPPTSLAKHSTSTAAWR